MKTNFASVSNDTPTAFITKNRQRIKQYPTNIVYLKNGDEFEIELFNPTQTKILAQIEMNGINISATGIVIKPGQRVYLERYLDVAKKFLFETYEIDPSDQAAQDAVLRNGIVSVKFSKEVVPNNNWYGAYGNSSLTIYPQHTGVYGGSFGTNDVTYFSGSVNLSSVNSCSASTVTTSNATYTSSVQPANISASVETGRVEKGSQSNQNFTTDYSNYGNVFSTSVWKLLPESVKPVEVSDLTLYCSSCGAKRKKATHKFCPNCGNKF